MTDHRGEYRLENLNPGEYFVVAIPQNQSLMRDGRVTRTGHAITYHPRRHVRRTRWRSESVSSRHRRQTYAWLRDTGGGIRHGIRIERATGAGRHDAHVAHGDNLFGLDSKAIRLRPDGSFMLPGLPPGTYFLQYREGQWPPPRDATPLVSGAKVVLDGRDLTGVRVNPIQMVHAAGRVIVDPAARAVFRPSTVRVSAFPKISDGNPGPQRGGLVQDDLSFRFATWPGPGFVRVSLEAPGWKVKTVRYKGMDVSETGLEFIDFKEGQEISGIEIELARADGRGGAISVP